jgi:hypothetical protein
VVIYIYLADINTIHISDFFFCFSHIVINHVFFFA